MLKNITYAGPSTNRRIKLLASGLNIGPLTQALKNSTDLWGQNAARTDPPESPHHGLSDIWCRFAPAGAGGGAQHESVWYPAADRLPVRQMARELMWLMSGEQLGGVLITRIPAGATCKPHTDTAWHAGFYSKFAVQIEADPGQTFCFDGEELVTQAGDLFSFDNSYLHWVTNPTLVDRITAIFCIRVDQSYGGTP